MLNETLGWFLILAGMLGGAALGLGFQDDDWMGGHGAYRRRILRLGHVALLALGFLNILFVHCLERLQLPQPLLSLAGWGLGIGAVSMPACCALMAWTRRAQPLFAVPVTSLVGGVALVACGLLP